MATGTTIRASKRPRHGRLFEPVAERRLEPVARALLSRLPGAEAGLRAFRDVAGPFGVPDLIAVVGDESTLERRRRTRVAPLLNEVDAAIVATASAHRPSSSVTVAKRLGWSQSLIDRRLPALVRSGALTMSDRGTLLRNEGLAPLGAIIAVELKVNDWRRALTQCRTYGLWADSYVMVLESLSDAARNMATESVRRDRAGLVIDGEVVLWPVPRGPAESRRLWGSEHVYAATIRR